MGDLLKTVKDAGALTFADFVMERHGYCMDVLADIWPHLDWGLHSELEAQVFTGTKDPATGAGGNVVAGFRDGIVHHMPAPEPLRFGSVAAVLSVRAVGGWG